MQAGGPPRFVPTLTEVVHDASQEADAHDAGASMTASGLHPHPPLAAWQAELAQPLHEALARVLDGCPPPPGADPAQVSLALQAALAQAVQLRHPRN